MWILSGACSSGDCRRAWQSRSARRWRASTPTSSGKARSRRPSTGTRQRTEAARLAGAREVDRGEVVVGVPAGGGVPPAGEQRAGEGERGAAGLRGLRGELGVLEGMLEREGGSEIPGQHAAGLLHGI